LCLLNTHDAEEGGSIFVFNWKK